MTGEVKRALATHCSSLTTHRVHGCQREKEAPVNKTSFFSAGHLTPAILLFFPPNAMRENLALRMG